MTRSRGTRPPPPAAASPLDAAMLGDEQTLADELAGIMEAVAGFDIGSIKGVVFQKPDNGQGPWQWCKDVYPPFDLSKVMEGIKEQFGPGYFQLRIFAAGKIRKNVDFSIAKERNSQAPVAATTLAGMGEPNGLLAILLSQQAEARREAQAASERQMNMFMAMGESQSKLLAAVLPALAGGGRQATSAAEIATLITALRPEGGGMLETSKAMAAMKDLIGAPGGGDDDGRISLDPEDLVQSGARLVGPAMKAIGDMFASRQAAGGGSSASGATPPGGVDQLALGPPPAGASQYRLIELVKVDVAYFFQRGHDPHLAAEAVYAVIEANHVTEAEIDQLAATFALSPTGLEDLAREGIDLRSNPAWAAAFFAELHAIHTGAEEDPAGGDGSQADP